MKKLLLSLFCLGLGFTIVSAQKITVKARIDSTIMKIGEQTGLRFEVSQQAKQKVIFPLFSDSIQGGLELVEPVKMDTADSGDGSIVVTQHCVVTSFHDSLLYIPPFPFVCDGDTVWSKSLSLKVVQPFKIDTAKQTIADIKPVMNAPYDWAGLAKTIVLVLITLGLLFLLWFLYKKYFRKSVVSVSKPEKVLAPHQIALNRLDSLKLKKDWQHDRSKEYHTELTEILREYIESTFQINSMEMTSEEILEQVRFMSDVPREVYRSLQQVLQLADLVKFAKWNPIPAEHEQSMANAYLFVRSTSEVLQVEVTSSEMK